MFVNTYVYIYVHYHIGIYPRRLIQTEFRGASMPHTERPILGLFCLYSRSLLPRCLIQSGLYT